MSRAVLSSNVKIDDLADTIEIFGIRYAGVVFRELGFAAPGTVLKINRREGGIVTLERIYQGG